MKYFIGSLTNRHGEFEVDFSCKFKTAEVHPIDYLNRIASTFWGDNSREDDGNYYFDGGQICVYASDIQEISIGTYNKITILATLRAPEKEKV